MSELTKAGPKEKATGLKHKPERASQRPLTFAAARYGAPGTSTIDRQPRGDDLLRRGSAPSRRDTAPFLPHEAPQGQVQTFLESGFLHDLSRIPPHTTDAEARPAIQREISLDAPTEERERPGESVLQSDGSGDVAPPAPARDRADIGEPMGYDLSGIPAHRDSNRAGPGRISQPSSPLISNVTGLSRVDHRPRREGAPGGVALPLAAPVQRQTAEVSKLEDEEKLLDMEAPLTGTEQATAEAEAPAPAAEPPTPTAAAEPPPAGTEEPSAEAPAEAEAEAAEPPAPTAAAEAPPAGTEQATGEAPLEAEAEAAAPAVAAAPAAEAVESQAETAQKSLVSETDAGTVKLAQEAATLIRDEMQQEPEESAGGGVVQRGILETIGGAVSRGMGWIMSNVVGPIRQLASAGWNRVTQLAGRFREAYAQADAPEWQVHRRAFQAVAAMRNQMATEAIARQRAERQRAVAEGRMTPAQAAEPTAAEQIDAATDMFESGVDAVLGAQSEMVEGAVLGDFKENPTIWHTVGQVAIGFVPYAGQVADVRDLVACIRKLHRSGWRDPMEWINLVLTVVGFIPGLGDLIKAGGRSAIRLLRETGPTVLRRGREIWQQVARRVPQLVEQARRFGRRLWDGARRQGEQLVNRARQLVQRAGDAARRAREAVQRAISRARERASSIARGIRESASNVVRRARGFLGRIGRAISGAVSQAMARARQLIGRATDLVRRGIARVQEVIGRLRQRASDFYQRARRFITETVPAAVRRAREWVQAAARRMREAVNRRVAQGRRMLQSAYRRAREFVTERVRGLKQRATRLLQERIRPMAGRIRDFLTERWNRLKERLGIRPNRIDLNAHERLGGHSLERHGAHIPDDELRQRVMGQHPSMPQSRHAMKFASREVHERAVNQAFRQHRDEIIQHFASGGTYREWTIDFPGAGTGFSNVGTRRNPIVQPATADRVTIAFDADPSAPGGFRMVTAFPDVR
jgi:hypothetical protein